MIAQKKKAGTKSSASLNTSVTGIPDQRTEDLVLFIKMKNGEEIMSIVERPGQQIEGLIKQVNEGPGDAAAKKLIIDIMKREHKQLSVIGEHMLEFNFPMKMLSVPTPKGNALLLEPWLSPTVSPSQSFRISMDDILTLAKPDQNIVEYYMSMVKKVLMSIAIRMNQLKKTGKWTDDDQAELNKQNHEKETEDYADEEIAEILSKVNKNIHSSNSSQLDANNVPFVMIMNEKKTLH